MKCYAKVSVGASLSHKGCLRSSLPLSICISGTHSHLVACRVLSLLTVAYMLPSGQLLGRCQGFALDLSLCKMIAPSLGFLVFTSPNMKLPVSLSSVTRLDPRSPPAVMNGEAVAFAGRGTGGDELVIGATENA